jgi:hypothetical protein
VLWVGGIEQRSSNGGARAPRAHDSGDGVSLRLGEHVGGEEMAQGEGNELGVRCGSLEDVVAWSVGPTPAYGCHDASTRHRQPEAGRPSPPQFQFELQHVKQSFETFATSQARNSSYLLDLYLMIQAESRGEPIDKVGA